METSRIRHLWRQQSRRILGVGDIGSKNKVIIKDVLLVEGLKHSLLSISQLCDRGYKITFEPEQCIIADSESTETVLVGKRVSNVYMLNVSSIIHSMNCLLSRDDESWLWHRRLAHIHMHHLNRIAYKDLVIGLPKLSLRGTSCVKHAKRVSKLKALLNRLMLFLQVDHLSCFTWIYLVP